MRVTPHQTVPGQGRAHGPAGRAAQRNDVDVFGEAAEQLLEDARREHRMTASSLAGDRDPAPRRGSHGIQLLSILSIRTEIS